MSPRPAHSHLGHGNRPLCNLAKVADANVTNLALLLQRGQRVKDCAHVLLPVWPMDLVQVNVCCLQILFWDGWCVCVWGGGAWFMLHGYRPNETLSERSSDSRSKAGSRWLGSTLEQMMTSSRLAPTAASACRGIETPAVWGLGKEK